MPGLGTLINTAAVVGGGVAGHYAGRFFKEEQQDAICKVCGISVLFIAIAGAMEGMLQITMDEAGKGASVVSGRSMFIVLCLALGTVIGELIRIEDAFERFGAWLKIKTGNAKDAKFVDAFGNKICAGLYHNHGHDLLNGQRMRFFSDPDLLLRGGNHPSGNTDRTSYDRNCHRQSLFGRVHPDLLRRRQPGMGKNCTRRQHAAGCPSGGDSRLPAACVINIFCNI